MADETNSIAVSDLKTSLRLDETDAGEDIALQSYLDAAESYVQDSVGADASFFATDDTEDLYKVAVLALASAYYQNPVALASSAVIPVDLVLNNIIGKLRYKWEASSDGSTE